MAPKSLPQCLQVIWSERRRLLAAMIDAPAWPLAMQLTCWRVNCTFRQSRGTIRPIPPTWSAWAVRGSLPSREPPHLHTGADSDLRHQPQVELPARMEKASVHGEISDR